MDKKVLQQIPKLVQRQDSTEQQLLDLIPIANRLGMYDAADVIQRLCDQRISNKLKESR